jgi:poly(hydroxyalkanoate) depolymerase family esterase
MLKSRIKRPARAVCIALVAIAGAAFVAPGAAGAATLPGGATTTKLPGLPSWTGALPWWSQLQDWLKNAGWTLPTGGGLPTPPTGGGGTTPPTGGGGTTPPTGGGGTTTPPTGGGGGTTPPTGGGGGTTPPTGGGGTGSGKGQTFSGTYSGTGGSRSYTGYVPSTYKSGTAVPLVVVLHGCTQNSDVMRQLTRFDQLAEAKGFIVVFPEQPSSANIQSCWNFFQDAQMHRGSGEPALIAGITQYVQQHYTVDTKRTYVAGLSAGGAMASVMGATYPDVYAAIGVGSGCEYDASATCAGYQSTDPTTAAKAALQAMGSFARPMPVIAFQGDKDTTVPPVNADQLVQQWTLTAALAAGSNAPLSGPAKTEDGQVPNGRSYTIKYYDDVAGDSLVEYWTVHGMSHAWSGGCSCEQYSDPQGPDETAAMYAFFSTHPMS